MTDLVSLPSASQQTRVEQTRAVAEVLAAVQAAHQYPRSTIKAGGEMREACAQTELAEVAFYSMPRGGDKVTGATIHLARELAEIWGNIDYGIRELHRDDDGGMSEMLAYAWDLERTTRVTAGFLVPHKRDTKTKGVVIIRDLQGIYENNANTGARRVRECIFAVLPRRFTEEAKRLCRDTLVKGGGKPIEQRTTECIEWYLERFRVDRRALERKVGKSAEDWTGYELADLKVLGGSLTRGETAVADAFPPEPVALDELGINVPTLLLERLSEALDEHGLCTEAEQVRIAGALAGVRITRLDQLAPAQVAGVLAQVRATVATHGDQAGGVLSALADERS